MGPEVSQRLIPLLCFCISFSQTALEVMGQMYLTLLNHYSFNHAKGFEINQAELLHGLMRLSTVNNQVIAGPCSCVKNVQG
jgi:hypothetical protein